MSSLLVVVGWYVVGFLVAHRLVAAGHSPVVWWTCAALLGACIVIPAAFAVAWRRRMPVGLDVVHRGRRTTTDLHVMAVAPVDQLCGTLDALPLTVGARADAVSVVATVGHEAYARGIATGERRRATKAIAAEVRPHSSTDDRIVTTQGARPLETVFSTIGVPDLLVQASRSRSQTRRALERDLRLCAAHDVPLLIASPARTRAEAPTPKASLTS